MSISLSAVASDCVLMLNAGSGYSGTVTDPRWSTQQIVDAILRADGIVAQTLIDAEDKEISSSLYSTVSGIANGGLITGDAIAIVSIQFVLTVGGSQPTVRGGILWDLAEITEEIQNPLGLNFDPHFYLEGRVLYHNGASIAASESATVSVNAHVIGYTTSGSPQSPDQYAYLVYIGAMAQLVPVEGENTETASYWGQLFMSGLTFIRESKKTELAGLTKVVREQILLKRLAQAA